jgi:tetratricopeptide (TPR) repeat protein
MEPQDTQEEGMSRTIVPVFVLAALLSLTWPPAAGRGAAPKKEDWDRYVKEVQERGAPVVRAVYKFKASCGLWPCSLDELVPDYASREQLRGWSFTWNGGGWWYLTDYGAFPEELLRYDHRSARKAGWMATDGEWETWLEGGEIIPPKVDVSDKERDAARVAVLRARIDRYKDAIIHHQGLVCWYYSQEDYKSAREACEQCLKRWPGHWWPNLMLAYIERKQGLADEADKQLARFTADHDDLTHWYLAGQFYAEARRWDKAKEALAKAGQARLSGLHGEKDSGEILGRSGEGFARDAAVLCYKQGWLEEALTVCDQWEQFRRKQGYGNMSYWAIRAACYLAQGKDEQARQAVDRILAEMKETNVGVKHLEELDEAIKRKNHDYHYDPGGYPPTSLVLIEYE